MTTTHQDANEREELIKFLIKYGLISEWRQLKGANREEVHQYVGAIANFIIADRKSQKAALLGSLLKEGPKDGSLLADLAYQGPEVPKKYKEKILEYYKGRNVANAEWRELIQAKQEEKA